MATEMPRGRTAAPAHKVQPVLGERFSVMAARFTRRRTLVVLGASDAYGVGTNDPDRDNWPTSLARQLHGQIHLVNLGVPGATLEDLRNADGSTGYAAVLQHGETGKGMNDYDAIFRLLADVNFCGWISLEDGMHGLEEMRRSTEFLKQKRAEYFA